MVFCDLDVNFTRETWGKESLWQRWIAYGMGKPLKLRVTLTTGEIKPQVKAHILVRVAGALKTASVVRRNLDSL
ncbi:hypothetical protein PISMIDRAFT_432437 [Pisolithus microcarpus 441]|uniref:Uncharacterized protein n=1 Tax=Pisolithus microcarpus 441 TaxID=765257 RepID=A0A0C9Z473_9AGAM|nr:hypothetical protein PISMIDRAFT_432437 [Pisolithus microcarpus 441]